MNNRQVGRPRRYNINQAYKIYEDKYNRLVKQQRKLGQSPRYSKMDFETFREDWEENRQYYGPKYSGKQVAEKLAQKDVYQHSYKQGKAMFKALSSDIDFEAEGISEKKFSLQYQKGLVDKNLGGFWNTVRQHQQALQQEGYSSNDISIIIGQQFFGSE